MPYEKYDPTWSGYTGDYLRGKVDISPLKPQHKFFDAIGPCRCQTDSDRNLYICIRMR